MLKHSFIVAIKDITLFFSKGAGIIQALIMGLLLIFIFSLSKGIDEQIPPQTAATIFWISSAFCQVIIFNMLYSFEETTGIWSNLLLSPIPVQAIWLGKAILGFIIILLTQCIFLPATIIFLAQSLTIFWWKSLWAIVLVDIGLVVLGSFLGAISKGQTIRESLLSIVLFPLMLPLLFAGIRICTEGFSIEYSEETISWLQIIIAFDIIFATAAFILFPFILIGDD